MDPVSARTVTVGDFRVAPVTRAAATVAAQPAVSPLASQSALAGLAASMAAAPPVDTDRVSQIKAAIAEGTYPILPETVADRLIALKLDWNPDDKA